MTPGGRREETGAKAPWPSAVFTDVDGTLLDGNHAVTSRAREAAHALAERGIPLVLVSARMPEALDAIRADLGTRAPVVCYGGAYVLGGDGEELLSRPISLGCALEVRDFVACDVPDVCCMVYGYHTWVTQDRSDSRVRREEQIVGVRSEEGVLEDHFSERGVHKFLLVGDPQTVQRAEREVAAEFPSLSVVRSSPILCEVMDGRVSKSEGIGAVCDRLGIGAGDAVAFGDGRNDIDMLGFVPESWAMANAPAEVRAAAAHVTALDNDHDGFAETILSLLEGR